MESWSNALFLLDDEVDLLAELKAFASKLFAGDLKLTDVVSGLGVGLPSKYQMPSVYVPLSKNVVAKSRSLRGLMTKRGIDNRRRTFLFHHKHKKHAPPPKVNCAGTYSAWSKCSHPCGNIGTMTRKFTITTHPSNGGTACPASVQSQACNRKSCPLPATAATLLNQIVGRAKTFIDNHGKSLFDVMEGLNSEVEILHRDHNAPISLPATYKTNVDEFVQVAAAFRALASSMETAAQLAQLSDTHSAPSFNETSLLVYEFTAELTEALDRMAEFSPKGASENVWDAVASSIQMATVAHPEKTSIGLNLLVAASTKDLMPIIISAGRHWMAKDFKGIGSDLGKIFVETWAQSVSSLQSLHSVVRGTWQADEEHACSLYNEFGFAFSHLAAVDRPGLDNDRKSTISTFPHVVIPDNETHGVVRLAYALNETSYATSSIPADLQLQITHAVKAIDEAARTGEIVVSSDGKLQSVFVETYTQKHRMDVGNFLKNAAQYWSKKNYAAVGYQLQAMIQQISK